MDQNQTSATPSDNRVMMSKSELSLYVKDGYPTGRLIGAAAALKGLTPEDIAAASGVSVAIVRAILKDGRGIRDTKKSVLIRIGDAVGLDLARMRFKAEGVHIFDVSSMGKTVNGWPIKEVMRAFGLLARDALAARIELDKTGSKDVIAVNSDSLRALVFDSKRTLFKSPRFNPGVIPSGGWVMKKSAPLTIKLVDAELASNIRGRDVTEREFDEIFAGTDGILWNDVKSAARLAGVSKAELMGFIKSRTEAMDTQEDEKMVQSASDSRRILRLVEAEPKAA